jgi:hypothetical protein
LTSLLSGAVSLVRAAPIESIDQPYRDLNGYSVPFRMALYTTKLLPKVYHDMTPQVQVAVLRLMSLTIEVASDQLGLAEKNRLWSSLADPETDTEVQDFMSAGQRSITWMLDGASAWRDESSQGQSAVARQLVSELLEASHGSSGSSYYAGRALSNVLSNLVEAHGWQSSGGEEWLTALGVLKTSTPDIFTATAVLTGLWENIGSSKVINTFCNRLISDVAGASADNPKTLGQLVLLNACLAVYESEEVPAAQNRIVFAVKQIISWFSTKKTPSPSIFAEAFRSLQFLLATMKDVYGSYWQTALDACTDQWATEVRADSLDAHLPAMHASLKLVILLKGLQDANDDLSEALVASDESISEGLIQLLAMPRSKEYQSLRIFDELLARQVSKTPLKHVKDISALYPLVASDFRLIQSAAFDILHRAIPAAQEQISIDVLLEDTGEIFHSKDMMADANLDVRR